MQRRSSQDWLSHLAADGTQQQEALASLRGLLLTRLRRALASNHKVDDGFLEDVAQEGLLKVLDSLDQFQGRSEFTTWATTIAIRLAFTEMRRARWKDVSLEQLAGQGDTPGLEGETQADAAARVQSSELLQTMHRVIQDKLTEKQRTALQAELRGVPQQEIGRLLGSNRNAIYKLVHDARKRLKAGMIEAGYSTEDLATFTGDPR